MMTWENAIPLEDPRVAQIRSAALYASDVHFDRKADYLVKGWLGSEAVSVVYGDSNCGKSFFSLDMSAHVASGQPWMGHNVRKGHVLYLAGEGGVKSYGPRIEAIRNAKSDLYHAGKDKSKGSRGHSSLRAAVDTEIKVKQERNVRTATCEKQRDMENGKKVAFTLRGVDLGLDDENDPITSGVVEHADVDLSSMTKSQPLKGNTLIAKQALGEAIAKHGRKMADTENYSASRRVVSVDVWRAEFLKMRIDSGVKEASIKKDFGRQAEALEASYLVRCYSDMVWFVHDEDRKDI